MEADTSHEAQAVRAMLLAGRFREAWQRTTEVLAGAPGRVGVLREAGLVACLLGDFPRAETFWREALAHAPEDAGLALRLADLLVAGKRFGEAQPLALKAWRGMPGSVCAAEVLGRVQEAEGVGGEQVTIGELAVAREAPEVAGLRVRWSGERAKAGGEFLEAARKAVCEAPSSRLGWRLLGRCAREAGRLEEACHAFLRAYEMRPGEDGVLVELGETLAELGRKAEGATCFVGATRLNPGNAEAFCRLGWVLMDFGQNQEALAALYRALALRPRWILPTRYVVAALLQTGQHRVALEKLRGALEQAPGDASLHSQMLSSLHYLPVQDRALRVAEFEGFARKFEGQGTACGPDCGAVWGPGATRRIRVGYVSGDFRRHSVAFFFEPLVEHHDRSAFEVFCYMTRAESDAVTERIRAAAEQWRQVERMSAEELAGLVCADGIDVLVDLSNHTAENRLPAFALRPAPVQVTMIGLHHTTGLRSVGYRITDAFLDPSGEEAFNTETLVRMERGAMVFAPPRDAPEVQASPCESGQPFTFACTNDLEKLNPGVMGLWAEILRALPESRLLFFSRPGNRLLAEMGKLGVSARRFVEVPRQPVEGFLRTHDRIDLVLDPFPYNGFTVTLLSAWMGVPCVTLSGNFPPARASECVLRRVGHPEFVAQSEEEYVRKAVALASEPGRLAEVRAGLRERVRRAWCDGPGYVRELEDAFRRMLAALPGKAGSEETR